MKSESSFDLEAQIVYTRLLALHNLRTRLKPSFLKVAGLTVGDRLEKQMRT